MTNLEYYKDQVAEIFRSDLICNRIEEINKYRDCKECPFNTNDKNTCCDYHKFIDWLLEEHKEPIKLKKWEYDLLKCYQEKKDDGEFLDHYILTEMQYKGHFQNVDYNLTIEEILDNCEVIEK